jgi:tetratricopeptide (TPR) repeat protein
VAPDGAVSRLLEEAWRHNKAGDYDRSNAVAERALRINHTEPEVYLVMASNYFAMTRLSLAEQLARQGLPLAGRNPAVKADLQSLLARIGALK